jgi:outer membrane receptor protein involved in Fe transport
MGKGKPQTRINTLTRCLMLSLAATAGCVASPTDVHAQAQQSTAGAVRFDIPAGPLAAALDSFAEQSGLQIVSDQPLQGIKVSALQGRLAPEEALRRLLRGSGFTYKRINAQTFVLKKQPTPSGPRRGARGQNTSGATQASKPEIQELAGVTVTGTRIRGGTTPSPVITIGSEQIQQEGFSDLGEVIRSIPQNFGGGQSPGVTAGAIQGSPDNQNVTGGSSLNLRGLGPDATLTLLNGHRMSYGGFSQAVDISAIPANAVERLEIVPDGASAIYGSDAVGGVANVVLKPDFDGVTIGARYGDASEGGLATHEYDATAGTTWATGGMILAGKKASNGPIYSDQRDYTRSMYQPSTLWQGNDLRSGVFSLHQSLGDAVELHLDALRSERAITTGTAYASAYYPSKTQNDVTSVAPGLEIWLPGDWMLTFGGAMGKDETSQVQQTVSRGIGAATSAALTRTYRNKSLTYEVGAEGPLFTLPGGEARLATGAGYRYNRFSYPSGDTIYADGDENSRFAYAELNMPLIAPEQGIGGVERLALTGAIRGEDGDYGRVTTPKFGVIYSPTADFSLKTSWGKSFKAPELVQRYYTQFAVYYPAATLGRAGYPADATALWLSGGNADLRPERARTWSASLAFHPEALPQLETQLTWFSIDYTARVVQPITTANDGVLGNPIYADFIDYDPAEATQAAALANVSSSNFINAAGAPYDASKVVAIVDSRYVNASRQRIKGADLSGSYRLDLGQGALTVRGSASWLHSTQALTAAQNPYDLAGTLFYPAKINARLGAVWQQGGFTASLFGNYKSGVTDTADGDKGASFTTFDATLRYDTGARDDAWANLTLALSAQNLLNRAPPLYGDTDLTYTPYDSTNYSAVGRFLSLLLSKHW